MSRENLQRVMTEIGPLTDALLSVVQLDESAWELSFENDTAIFAQYDAAASRVTFTLNAGPLPPDNLTAAYELMLTYNACWSETGGIRLAMDRPGGDAILLLDIFSTDMDVTQLSTVIAGLLQKQWRWCEAFSSLSANDAEASIPLSNPPGSLRV